MQKAGVIGEPEFYFLDEVEHVRGRPREIFLPIPAFLLFAHVQKR